MTSHLLSVTYAAHDPARAAAFWSQMLDREVVTDADGHLLPGGPTQVGLRFVQARDPKRGLDRMHLHLTSEGFDQDTVVARALALGARHLDVGQLPHEDHVVLADPDGNELCVIPPGNRFLTGCGPLGEVACDGTRAVGLFWSGALDWPLVWDEQQETAVQDPEAARRSRGAGRRSRRSLRRPGNGSSCAPTTRAPRPSDSSPSVPTAVVTPSTASC